jgi:hypothetical protein
MPGLLAIVVVATLAVWDAAPAAAAQAPEAQSSRVNADAQILLAFGKRVQDYVESHRTLEATLPPLPREATPGQIERHQHALTALIVKARPRAKHGDLFGPDARALIRRLLSRALSGPDGKKLLATIWQDNPGPIRVQVNGRYPEAAPRSTMPAQVLEMMPKLPEEIEYRFVGRRLILLDAHAMLVLDYVSDALPK